MEAEIIRDHKRAKRPDTHPECIRELLATVRLMLSLGWDDDTMCIEFGVTQAKLGEYKKTLMAKEQMRLSHRPVEELFIEHRIMVMADVQALDIIADKAEKDGQFPSAVAARRARSQLLDRLFDRGQECGVIPRAAKKVEMLGGMIVAHMSNDELADYMAKMAKDMTTLQARYGTSSFKDMGPPTQLYKDDVIDAVETPEKQPAVVRKPARK